MQFKVELWFSEPVQPRVVSPEEFGGTPRTKGSDVDAAADVYMTEKVEVDGVKKKCYWSSTGIPNIDYSPIEERWATLEGIFEAHEQNNKNNDSGKCGDVYKKNFITTLSESMAMTRTSPRRCV